MSETSTRQPGPSGRTKWRSPIRLTAIAAAGLTVVALVFTLTSSYMTKIDQGGRTSAAQIAAPSSPLVGKTAPSFTLLSATGQPYTYTPGDGKKHVFVF